ncbi:hypothetical protein J6590_106495, partial [Homalodisca vitripennis]
MGWDSVMSIEVISGAPESTVRLGYSLDGISSNSRKTEEGGGQSPSDRKARDEMRIESELVGYVIPWMAYPQIQERLKKEEARVLQT